MYPSSPRPINPARSEITPPLAANRYGIAMRRVCARKASKIIVPSATCAVLRGLGLQAGGAKLESAARAKQEPPRHDRRDERDEQYDVRRRAVKGSDVRRESRQRAGVNLGRVQRAFDLEMRGREIIQQRE